MMPGTASSWAQPRDVTDLDLAFPAGDTMRRLLPPWGGLPDSMRAGAHPYARLAQRLTKRHDLSTRREVEEHPAMRSLFRDYEGLYERARHVLGKGSN